MTTYERAKQDRDYWQDRIDRYGTRNANEALTLPQLRALRDQAQSRMAAQ
jgi:hypothetical protein